MTEILEYAPCMWYCPNCGGLVKGFRSKNSTVKAECNVCRTVMVWKIKSPRHICFDTYAPVIIGA